MTWLCSYLPTYIGMVYFHLPPETLWLFTTGNSLAIAVMFFVRAKALIIQHKPALLAV